MSVGSLERKTQNRLVALFRDDLDYTYLGDCQDRANANIEVELLEKNLLKRGYRPSQISKAIDKLRSDAQIGAGRDLYEANKDVYSLLRYGVKVKTGVGEQTETVWLVDWKNGQNNFAIAEEVTVVGRNTKRPDIVLYINGIAVVTLELKRSKVSVSEGIRQTISNQRGEFIPQFFTTNQLVLAGNDVEGLRYAVIDTPEKYWLQWKEASTIENPLDREITQLCSKERLLELIYDFMVFDGGVKKTCRHNQYFGVRAAQDHVERREGGIIWHAQGSGKSLTMVWLAKWIREHRQNARVVIITDRTELDEQIERVFHGVNESIHRTSGGDDMIAALAKSEPWLICSLIHKFRGDEAEPDLNEADAEFLQQIKTKVPADFKAKGNLYVFVDEAHRTQSGKMHEAMKQLLPEAMFIGFTGTPLLKTDKATSAETFGRIIHSYKFDEAVIDGVILDLRYEARDIEQHLNSPATVDKWFDAKTKGMTDLSKAELKRRWGTMQRVFSAEARSKQLVQDVLIDMETKPRLVDGTGSAMLVTSDIYQACTLYDLFVKSGFRGKCAVVTSYKPSASDISREDSGEGDTEAIRRYEIYQQMLADHFGIPTDEVMKNIDARVEQFEKDVKQRFIKEPGRMRLLIVVDKLLTGFDAPPATYLYIDKKMQDHGLFQAVCRVNRLDGDDKDYGYIIDYRDLFKSLETAVGDYTSDAFEGYEREDIEGLLTDRIERAREDLDEALEAVAALCEPVAPPTGTIQYQHYFCTKDGDAKLLADNEPKRVALYKSVAALTRAYANLANDMDAAGYSPVQAAQIKKDVKHYSDVRDEVQLGAGESIDYKQYEASMRRLLDTYIEADAPEVVADFGETGLVELIAQRGPDAIKALPTGIQSDPEAVAETIANNIRKVIVDERALNPKYYDKMSELLDALIEQRRQGALDYKRYLEDLIRHAQQVATKQSDIIYPDWANNDSRKALHDFEFPVPELAIEVDGAVMSTKPDNWVGSPIKEKKVRRAVARVLPDGYDRLDELMELLRAQLEYR